ncbi:MAG TPA: TetR/AcrR family transcriptional regulator [Rhizomicrobium sp.]
MAEKNTVRQQILDAAKKRFSHFGYAKTTMAEVAADCRMSPGNLYRFFAGKLDIAEAIATVEHELHLEDMRKLLAAPGKSAGERLRDYFFEEMRRTYKTLEENPRIQEIAGLIASQRPHYADWMRASSRKLLVGLFDEAERNGEFRPGDKEFAVEMIQAATMKFRYPQLWTKLTLPQLERELDGVLKLVVNGLNAQKAHKHAAPAE